MHPFLVVIERALIIISRRILKGPLDGGPLADFQMAWLKSVSYYLDFVFLWLYFRSLDRLYIQELWLLSRLLCSILHYNLFFRLFKILNWQMSAIRLGLILVVLSGF